MTKNDFEKKNEIFWTEIFFWQLFKMTFFGSKIMIFWIEKWKFFEVVQKKIQPKFSSIKNIFSTQKIFGFFFKIIFCHEKINFFDGIFFKSESPDQGESF